MSDISVQTTDTHAETSRFKASLMRFVRQEQNGLAQKIHESPFHPLAALILEAGYEVEEIASRPAFSHIEAFAYTGLKRDHQPAWGQSFPPADDILKICDVIGMHPSLLWVSNPHVPMPEALLEAQVQILQDEDYGALDHNAAFGALQLERQMAATVLKNEPQHKALLEECDDAYDEVRPRVRPVLSVIRDNSLTQDDGLSQKFHAPLSFQEKARLEGGQRERMDAAKECALSLRHAHELAVCDKAAHLRGRNLLAMDGLCDTLSGWYEEKATLVFDNIQKWVFKNRKEYNLEAKLARKLLRTPQIFGTFKAEQVGMAEMDDLDAQLDSHFFLKGLGLIKEPENAYAAAPDDRVRQTYSPQRVAEVNAFVRSYFRYALREGRAIEATNDFLLSAKRNQRFRNEISQQGFSDSAGFYTNLGTLNEVLRESGCGPVVMSAAEEKAIIREIQEESRRPASSPAYL